MLKKCCDLEMGVKGHSRSSETDTYRSATCDFLLTFHSNHGSILHHFRDRRRFQSKIAKIFPPRVFTPPLNGFPLEFGIDGSGQKTRMMGLLDG